MSDRQRFLVVGSFALACASVAFGVDTSSGRPEWSPGSAPPPLSPDLVLYDQMDSSAGISVPSQDYEAALDIFDNQAADDFVVPAAGWTITGVDVDGEYGGTGPAASFHVFFYADSGGLPGTLAASRTAQSFTGTAGDASIALIPPVVLSPGTYWVSVQARQDSIPHGDWIWDTRAVQSNSLAAWQNPGGGYGPGCQTWGVMATCVPSANAPDLLFRLTGAPGNAIFVDNFETAAVCMWSNARYTSTATTGAAIVPGSVDVGNHADDGSTTIALPFPYRLYDTLFTSVAAGSNGFLAFGAANSAFNASCIPIAGATYAIGPYWTDQCTGACTGVTCTGCGIFTSTSGSAPNRIFNIEYRTRYYNSGGAGVPLNYEVRLYEGLFRYEVIYGTVNPFTPPSARNLSIGVQETPTGGNHTLQVCDPTGGASPPVLAGDKYTWNGCTVP
ncbi:MAG: choice-of-anchor R domain-containing protein [Thermoanaerobaculia bacterium]